MGGRASNLMCGIDPDFAGYFNGKGSLGICQTYPTMRSSYTCSGQAQVSYTVACSLHNRNGMRPMDEGDEYQVSVCPLSVILSWLLCGEDEVQMAKARLCNYVLLTSWLRRTG